MDLPTVSIYTDGACARNPGPGGWGALLLFHNSSQFKIFGYELHTTNNRMEILAAIEALKTLECKYKVSIYTDSKYLQCGICEWINKWILNEWRTSNNNNVKNIDLWRSLYNESSKHQITWCWVRGHSGNKYNTIADELSCHGKQIAQNLLNPK